VAAHHAVDDFLGKLTGIARATEHSGTSLVSVILDGENCWEYYPNGGVDFLRALYGRLARSHAIRTTTVSDYLAQHPPRDTLPRLFSGSWISHNFAIWIGHDEDRRAWDVLHETREYLTRAAARGGIERDKLQQAWRELHIAEGSDWYWWFGDDHHSAQDHVFDYLFRKHLQNVYTLLGGTPPTSLSQPITGGPRKKLHTDPRGFLEVRVDGRFSYFEWNDAGVYVAGSERGTMTRVTHGLVKQLHFGFDAQRLFLRIDTAGSAREALTANAVDELRVKFLAPVNYDLSVSQLLTRQPHIDLRQNGEQVVDSGVELAIGKIVEVAIEFQRLGVVPDQPLNLCVELVSRGTSVERVPQEAAIEMTVPSPDFERIMWS
jgi:hypothetical protein